jgi:uncharacterized protein YneR
MKKFKFSNEETGEVLELQAKSKVEAWNYIIENHDEWYTKGFDKGVEVK